jgi:hypothetical protein
LVHDNGGTFFQQDCDHWKEVPPEAVQRKVSDKFRSTIKEERRKAQSWCSKGELTVPVKNTAMTTVRATIETLSKLDTIEVEGDFYKIEKIEEKRLGWECTSMLSPLPMRIWKAFFL